MSIFRVVLIVFQAFLGMIGIVLTDLDVWVSGFFKSEVYFRLSMDFASDPTWSLMECKKLKTLSNFDLNSGPPTHGEHFPFHEFVLTQILKNSVQIKD